MEIGGGNQSDGMLAIREKREGGIFTEEFWEQIILVARGHLRIA